ncbi:SCO7613 C-terminal domain-containing membrane protein [Trujillonella humicola]|uniref:SCO7613 C-terminal domain-containing membrane protein n=1 Tax=Trujillonella humicola TaxID=3383699 RepID=UPI003905D6ED
MADLSSRVRPPHVLLAVGAVLLLAGTLAAPAQGGAGSAPALLLAAVVAGALSARASRAGLRGTRETLAATAVVLALAGIAPDGPLPGGTPLGPALLALTLAGLARLQPAPLSWPLGAWVAGQLAAARVLADLPDGVLRTGLLLAVALAGLLVVLGARTSLARIALVTAVPWWVLGVTAGIGSAWTAPAPAAGASAALVLAAAAGLLVVRLERSVSPLLGPPRAAPLLAGAVSGAAVAGTLSGGPGGEVVAGYAGVLLAAVAAARLEGRWRGLLLPVALAAGATLVACALTQLVAAGAWRGLVLLLLLTAAPAVVVARRRREDRPAAVPLAVGCLVAAALLAVPAQLLGPAEAAAVLTALYGAALAGTSGLAADTRRHTLAVGVLSAAAAVLLVTTAASSGHVTAHLAAQGAMTWSWAVLRRPAAEAARARAAGAAQLVLAAWVAGAAAGADAVEVYTLPAAAGLLLAAGPELRRRPSERAWGPGLLVAAVPSTVLAVVTPGTARPLLVLVAAALAMVGGAAAGIRTPLLTGAGTAVALAVGLAVVALPLPLAGALAAGVALLAVGARRELRPVGGFAERVAEMR